MHEQNGNDEFAPIEISEAVTPKAKREAEQLESNHIDPAPNSVFIQIGRFGHIHWKAESSAPLFCFLSIVALLVFGLILAGIAACNSAMTWPSEAFKFLGQSILTLIGAVVGASAATGASTRSRRGGPRS